MIFTELRFIAFFAAVFGVHWALRSDRARKVWLLLCSYAFYAAWKWQYLGLLLVSTAVDYVAGRMLDKEVSQSPGRRRLWLAVSVTANLALLGFFKYYNFLLEPLAALLDSAGLPCPLPFLEVALPVGISFYTFQKLSYTIDVYQGSIRAEKDPLDFALFVGFFPQLLAGPISRAGSLLPQIRKGWSSASVDVRACITLFLFGFIKKACVSDNIAPLVDEVYSDPAAYDWASAWLATALFHVQIYCDFSGYSDMAIALAGLLGLRLPLNFDYPYFSRTVSELWRRWHITLSTWLRDYVFVFMLGSKRASRRRMLLNVFLTMLVSGLWHKASWMFVIVGAGHGLLMVLERLTGIAERAVRGKGWRWSVLGPLYVNLAFALLLVAFRSDDVSRLGVMYRKLLLGGEGTGATLDPHWWRVVAGFFLVHFAMWRQWGAALRRMPWWAYAFSLGVAMALVLPFASRGYQTFVYFEF